MDHSHSVIDAVDNYFSTSGFMPHGHCYLWKPVLVGLHVISDSLIGIAYLGISFLLYRLVKKIKLPFSGMFLAFGAFIAFCGWTHFNEVYTLWVPNYWYSGVVKAVTAFASVATYIYLFPIGPKIVEMAGAARLSEERRVLLESQNKELELLYKKLMDSDALKTQFFANVSHELRTPLTLILGTTEQLLEDQELDSEHRKKLEVSLRNGRTLLNQVNALLDISKLEAGKLEVKYEKADLVQLVRYINSHFEGLLRDRKIKHELILPESLIGEVDLEKLQRVYMNLLSNAVKFTPDGGWIRTSITQEDNNFLLSVEDSGPGIAPDFREKIFERFSQGEVGINRKFGGTGLGLAIVKDFVDMQGGTVRVRDNGAGALFEIRIPVFAPEGTSVDARLKEATNEESIIQGSIQELIPLKVHLTPANQSQGIPTVIVCEDNLDMNNFIIDSLSEVFNVVSAINGKEGLEKAMSLRPDLIITDIMMPLMGGDELLKSIKESNALKTIPVLILSARSDDKLRANLLKQGADDYVVKPFDREELKARASNLITIKKTRDTLEEELKVSSTDLAAMAKEVTIRKREAETAREAAEVAMEQAQKANEMKSAFLALASHELNTPVTSVDLNLHLLQKQINEVLSPRQLSMIERAIIASKNLKDLIEGLLEYTRVESGKMIVQTKRIDLNSILREVVEEVSSLAERKNLELKLNLMPEILIFDSDPRLVKVIIRNLISNAIKYTDKGKVMIGLEKSGGNILLSVADTGAGMSEDQKKLIFNPFYQVEPLAQKSTSGFGLGLALVKEILSFIGGKIEVISEVGKGSTFKVILPSN